VARRKREYEAPDLEAAAVRMMRALVRRAEGGELEALEALVRLQDVVEEQTHAGVLAYREGPAEASWADIGRVVGTTRQAAQIRYGRKVGA
jgi:hypothetical protein